MAMIAFSFLLYIFPVIGPSFKFQKKTIPTSTIHLPPLLHLKEKLQPFCTHCIFVHMLFFNLLLHTNLYTYLYKFITYQNSLHQPIPRLTPSRSTLSQKYLFILLYICLNFVLTCTIYLDTLPILSLLYLPTLLSLYGLHSSRPLASTISHVIYSTSFSSEEFNIYS